MKVIIAVISFFSFFCYASDQNLTALDQWQKAVNVAVVQLEDFFSVFKEVEVPTKDGRSIFYERRMIEVRYAKLRIKDLWSQRESFQNEIVYTVASVTKKDIGKVFIGTFNSQSTIDTNYGFFLNKTLNTKDAIYMSRSADLETWLVIKNSKGKWYVSGCIDGLTSTPLINPLLEQVRQLAVSRIDEQLSTGIASFLWPTSEETGFTGKRCGE